MPPWRATHNQTYSTLAEAIGLHRCRGILPHSGQRCYERHEGGASGGSITMEAPYPYVHWSDRRMTRAGIKAFLLLAAQTKVEDDPHSPTWVTTFRRIVWARNWLVELGFRFAKTEWKVEKASLRAQIVQAGVPAAETDEKLLHVRAMAWSRPA